MNKAKLINIGSNYIYNRQLEDLVTTVPVRHSSPFLYVFYPAVASDRISIQSMGHMTPQLSPQNLISCDTRNQGGCAGGRIDGAWWYLRRRG